MRKTFPEPMTGCWLWGGALSKKRNGLRPVVRLAGGGSRVVLVARLMLSLYRGDPPSELHEAGHTCPYGEQSACINPEHLDWMTREENERFKR